MLQNRLTLSGRSDACVPLPPSVPPPPGFRLKRSSGLTSSAEMKLNSRVVSNAGMKWWLRQYCGGVGTFVDATAANPKSHITDEV